VKTLVTHAIETWNSCAELRDSSKKVEASRAATTLAKNSPLWGSQEDDIKNCV
jgi:hypothetical protein